MALAAPFVGAAIAVHFEREQKGGGNCHAPRAELDACMHLSDSWCDLK
jgi:hypothetical protein